MIIWVTWVIYYNKKIHVYQYAYELSHEPAEIQINTAHHINNGSLNVCQHNWYKRFEMLPMDQYFFAFLALLGNLNTYSFLSLLLKDYWSPDIRTSALKTIVVP